MKALIVLLILTLNLTAQTNIGVEIDPTMITKEKGLDFTVVITDDQPILGYDFRIGVILEMYGKRHYYGAGVTLDYPIEYGYAFASIGVELGLIVRDKVPLPYAPGETTFQKYRTHGLNANLGFWITNDLAVTARLNYKRRGDLDRWAVKGDDYRHSVYIGFKYKIKTK